MNSRTLYWLTNGRLLLATHRHRFRLRRAVLECWWRNACTSSPHVSGCSCLRKHRPHMTTSAHCEAAVHWVEERNSGQGGGAQRAHLYRLEAAGHSGRAGDKCCEGLQAREAAASVRGWTTPMQGKRQTQLPGARGCQGPAMERLAARLAATKEFTAIGIFFELVAVPATTAAEAHGASTLCIAPGG